MEMKNPRPGCRRPKRGEMAFSASLRYVIHFFSAAVIVVSVVVVAVVVTFEFDSVNTNTHRMQNVFVYPNSFGGAKQQQIGARMHRA